MFPIVAQLAAKIEAQAGVAETLAAADCVLAENLVFRNNTTILPRNPVRRTLSPYPNLTGHRYASIEFDVELKGSGAAGTAPEIGKLLRACGLDEDIVVSTSVTYTPLTDDGHPTLTIGIYEDGVLKKIWGARGTFRLACLANNIPKLHFVFTGIDFSVTDAPLLSNPTYNSSKPVPFHDATLTIAGYAASIASLEIDAGNVMAAQPRVNRNVVQIGGRVPKLTFDPEMVLVATHDFYGKLRDGIEGALNVVIGAIAGNICTIGAPKTQYQEIAEAESEGFRTLGITCQLNGNNGDDEYSFAFT